MEVEANVSETLPEEEKDEIMGEGAEGEDGSSDSDDSDANEAAVDPKIQQLELQVTSCFSCLPLILLVVSLLKTRKEKNTVFITLPHLTTVSQQFCYLCTALQCN